MQPRYQNICAYECPICIPETAMLNSQPTSQRPQPHQNKFRQEAEKSAQSQASWICFPSSRQHQHLAVHPIATTQLWLRQRPWPQGKLCHRQTASCAGRGALATVGRASAQLHHGR
jgi:hypothetical protein